MINETNESKENCNTENYVSSDEEIKETESDIEENLINASYMGMMSVRNANYHLMNRSEAEGRLKLKLGTNYGAVLRMCMCVVCCRRIGEIWNYTIPACGHHIHQECLLENILDNGMDSDGTLWCPLCQYMKKERRTLKTLFKHMFINVVIH